MLSSDRPPRAMTILEDRLRSRFEWGLTRRRAAARLRDTDRHPALEAQRIARRSRAAGGRRLHRPEGAEQYPRAGRAASIGCSRTRAICKQPVTVDLAAVALHDLVAAGPSADGVDAGEHPACRRALLRGVDRGDSRATLAHTRRWSCRARSPCICCGRTRTCPRPRSADCSSGTTPPSCTGSSGGQRHRPRRPESGLRARRARDHRRQPRQLDGVNPKSEPSQGIVAGRLML